MKILLLNQVFYPDVASSGQHLKDLAIGLASNGHDVSVVSSSRAYDKPDILFPKYENWRGIKIYRIGSTGFGKKSKLTRSIDFASFLASCIWRLVRLPRHDVVIALTSPPLISVLGAIAARRWRAKFFYWIMDFNPDEAIAAGWLCANSLPARALDKMSRFSLRNAEKIIALDRFMKERIIGKKIPPERIVTIPPWAHDDDVRYDESGRNRFRAQHGLDGKFVVMYSGNHSPVHPLDTLIEAAKRLNGDKTMIFLFVGGGSQFGRVKRFAEDNKLSNILCLPYQPLDQLSASLSAADLHTVVMGDAMVGLVHPCKIYNILGIGSSFLYIGPNQSHITEIVSELNGQLPVASHRHNDIDGVVQSIRRIAASALVSASDSKSKSLSFNSRYSKQVWLPEFTSLLGPPEEVVE